MSFNRTNIDETLAEITDTQYQLHAEYVALISLQENIQSISKAALLQIDSERAFQKACHARNAASKSAHQLERKMKAADLQITLSSMELHHLKNHEESNELKTSLQNNRATCVTEAWELRQSSRLANHHLLQLEKECEKLLIARNNDENYQAVFEQVNALTPSFAVTQLTRSLHLALHETLPEYIALLTDIKNNKNTPDSIQQLEKFSALHQKIKSHLTESQTVREAMQNNLQNFIEDHQDKKHSSLPSLPPLESSPSLRHVSENEVSFRMRNLSDHCPVSPLSSHIQPLVKSTSTTSPSLPPITGNDETFLRRRRG